jgi:hypothetical protein
MGAFEFFELSPFVGTVYDFSLKDNDFLARTSPVTGVSTFQFVTNVMMKIARNCLSADDDTNPDILYLIKAVMRMMDCQRLKLDSQHYSIVIDHFREIEA